MILVDTSVWIDHLHRAEPALIELLERASVVVHPMVIGELALGSIRDRDALLSALAGLTSSTVATNDEVLHLVESRRLHGRGLGLVDVHLLAAVLLSDGVLLWTRDKRLRVAADEVGVRTASIPPLIR